MKIYKSPKITIEGNLHLSRVVALLDFINKNQYLKSDDWFITQNSNSGYIYAYSEDLCRTFIAIEYGYSSDYIITVKEHHFLPYSGLEFFDDEISFIFNDKYQDMKEDDKDYFNQCLQQMIDEKTSWFEEAQEIIDKIDVLTNI